MSDKGGDGLAGYRIHVTPGHIRFLDRDPASEQRVGSVFACRAIVMETARRMGMERAFIDWLRANWSIWTQFCDLAEMVQARGRKTWSARAICHVLRWNRVVRDASDPTYKINNNWTPSMARLYNRIHGARFFTLRGAGIDRA